MIDDEKDLVLAIHHLKSTLTTTISCQHAYGHQDRGSGRTRTKEQDHSVPAHVTTQDSTDRDAAPSPTPPRASLGPSSRPQQESSSTRDDTKNKEYNEITENLRRGTLAQQQQKQRKEEAVKREHGRELNASPILDPPQPADNIMRG